MARKASINQQEQGQETPLELASCRYLALGAMERACTEKGWRS